jgi:hypothetical protein
MIIAENAAKEQAIRDQCAEKVDVVGSENTHWRIRWFQIFSISVLVITAVWQLIYWRRFFKSKKLL